MGIIEQLIHFVPIIKQLNIGDIGISVTDTEKFVYYEPGQKLDLKVTVGTALTEEMITYQAMKSRTRLLKRMDASLWGIPFIAVAIPIIDDECGEVIGAISLQETVDRQNTLKELSHTFTSNINVLASTTQEITAQAQEITSICQGLSSLVMESVARTKETDGVIRFIREISGQTNLLGLNAAIEAARVGEQGRGFGVVAEEIRKLATSSAESVQKIGQSISTIQVDSEAISRQINQVENVITDLAGAISQIATSIQQAASDANKLDNIAQELER